MHDIIALLTDRPVDVDLTLLHKNEASDFVKKYYAKVGELPDIKLFAQEMGIERPTAIAPWQFYEQKLKEEKFIKEALPALTKFNDEYDKDQKKALLSLREKLVNLAEPSEALSPVSIVKDISRYETFKDTSNARIKTGLAPLDEASGGLATKDELMIISARLGIGKSWVAHSIAAHMCVSGYRVGMYSGEMSEDEVGARFDSLTSHVSNYGITRGKDIDLEDHKAKLAAITGEFLVLTPQQLRHAARPSDIRRFVRQYDLDCVIMDQLSLMEPDGMRGGESYERKAMLSLQLKSLQQELRIPFIAVSQLNRGAAQQEADASNIAGSDRIGQDATLILALTRKDETLKIKVLKARSFRIPDQPWEFTWDIDKGILEPKLSAMDAVMAKVKQAKAKQAASDAAKPAPSNQEESDEIW